MVEWEKGEFYDNSIVKKKIVLTKGEETVDIDEFLKEVHTIVRETQTENFEEMGRTILPLAKYFAHSFDELHGFLMGFLVGCKFERDGIQISIEEMELTPAEKEEISMIKMGIADFKSRNL